LAPAPARAAGERSARRLEARRLAQENAKLVVDRLDLGLDKVLRVHLWCV
jgi:hypothetical protein